MYIVLKGTINGKAEKDVAFKKNPSFRLRISKSNRTLIGNEGDLDIVISMYNLLEYHDNYSTTSGRLWNYYGEEVDDADDNALQGKSFEYKTKIKKNTTTTSTAWKFRRNRSTSTTNCASFKPISYYCSQIH